MANVILQKMLSAVITAILFALLLRGIFNLEVPIWALMMYSGLVNFVLAAPSSLLIEFLMQKVFRTLNTIYAILYILLHAAAALIPFWYVYKDETPGVQSTIIIATAFTAIVYVIADLLLKRYMMSRVEV